MRKIEEKVDGKEFDDGATNDDDDSADKDIVFPERKMRPKLVLEIDPRKLLSRLLVHLIGWACPTDKPP